MKISTREKRFLIAGSIGVVLVLGLLFGDQWMPSRQGLSSSLDYKKKLLLKYRETVNQEEAYKARLQQYQERLRLGGVRLLAGDNPSIAGAELQRVLADIASRIGVEISRKTPQPEQKIQDNLIKVSVSIETNCMPDQLVQLIAAVESYEKFLIVDELMINSFRIQKKTEIRPNLKVSGYILGPPLKPGEKPASAESRAAN